MHVRSLKFDEKPNYELLKNLLRDCLKKNNLEYDFYYDWDKVDEKKGKFLNK